MAFTNNPVIDTYSSEKIVLMHDLDLAPAGTDLSSLIGGAVNILPFKDEKGEIYGETRYSIQAESITFSADANHVGMTVPGSNAIVRGLYVWERDQDFFNYFVVVDDSVGSRVFMKFYPDTGPGHPFGWVQCTTLPMVALYFIQQDVVLLGSAITSAPRILVSWLCLMALICTPSMMVAT
jgi:hypothetical protein